MMQNLKIQYPGRARIRVRFRVPDRGAAVDAVVAVARANLGGFYLRWATFEKHQRSNTHHVAAHWEPIEEGNVRVLAEPDLTRWLEKVLRHGPRIA